MNCLPVLPTILQRKGETCPTHAGGLWYLPRLLYVGGLYLPNTSQPARLYYSNNTRRPVDLYKPPRHLTLYRKLLTYFIRLKYKYSTEHFAVFRHL